MKTQYWVWIGWFGGMGYMALAEMTPEFWQKILVALLLYLPAFIWASWCDSKKHSRGGE